MLLFGIPALIVTGLSWSLVGVVMSSAPRKRVATRDVQFFGAVFTVLCSLVIGILGWRSGEITTATIQAAIWYFLSGVLNFIFLQLMSRAMQKGPNGIIWSMVQSGMLLPFLMGLIWFDEKLSVMRGIGMGMLLLALVCFARTKDAEGNSATVNGSASSHSRGWLPLTMGAFLLCGMQQCCSNFPSYYPEMSVLSPVWRAMIAACGTLFFSGIEILWNAWRQRCLPFSDGALRNRWLWFYLVMLQSFSLVASYFLLYRGLDALAKADAGALSYPLLVGSCVVGFLLYSTFFLKERCSWMQQVALLCCICGIVCLCL